VIHVTAIGSRAYDVVRSFQPILTRSRYDSTRRLTPARLWIRRGAQGRPDTDADLMQARSGAYFLAVSFLIWSCFSSICFLSLSCATLLPVPADNSGPYVPGCCFPD
jgi:hypothetical protein